MVFGVRPVWRHFILWVLLAPLLLVEAGALREFFDLRTLQDLMRTRRTTAQIVESRKEHMDTTEIRYRFQVPDDPTWYSHSDMTGRKSLWVSVNNSAWENARRNDSRIEVVYLPENPWVNQPVSLAGTPVLDSFCGWGLFFSYDLLWIFETVIIVRNYLRCRQAAESMRPLRVHFWESREL
jgi:hypothetical protein